MYKTDKDTAMFKSNQLDLTIRHMRNQYIKHKLMGKHIERIFSMMIIKADWTI